MKFASTAALAMVLALAAAQPAFAADAAAKSVTPQQQRMKDCNAQATGKKGEERRAFMSTCLKGAPAAATETAAQPAKSKSKGAGKTAH